MASVTRRIENVQQPRLGYLPISIFNKHYFVIDQINDVPTSYKHIQGMVVDYLTRYVIDGNKYHAFQFSLMGAKNVGEFEKAKKLVERIKGLDEDSIVAACQLVGYDVAYRRGPNYFASIEKIQPSSSLIHNISVLVARSVEFLQTNKPVVLYGFTFENAYNDVVSSGDGDFLTNDTLWDFKVSKSEPDIKDTLQILVYYILGIHSIHRELFKKVEKIGIFNPELNVAYSVCVSDISDEIFQAVSRDVIGYNTPEDAKIWRTATGTSSQKIEDIKVQYKDTGFSPDKYEDGIYDITVDDYWSYYQKITDNPRPKFLYTKSVKFIKNSEFFMFVSVSEKGKLCLLQGGNTRSLYRSLQYYYERLPEYANTILQKFSKYWDALYGISKQIQSVSFNDEEIKQMYEKYKSECKNFEWEGMDFESWCLLKKHTFRLSGKVHGCIVDIDFLNHIYLNPFDGTVAAYFATSMEDKHIYKNVSSLITAKKEEMLPAFNRIIEENSNKESTSLVLADSNERMVLPVLERQDIDTYSELVTDTSMYEISNRMKMLQEIYDHKLIVVWYDNVLPHYELESERKLPKRLSVGEQNNMNCGMVATVLSDNGCNAVTIQFEDGTIVKNCRRDRFREGRIGTPTLKKKKSSVALPAQKSIVGQTAIMNCGLKATVVEDLGCNNITVQFEDGLVRKNCRRDKFREGKIAHKL